jgi:hypothetical protein
MDLLRSGAGSRFDPALIQTLERPEVLERWVRIAEEGKIEERGIVNGSSDRSDSSAPR